MTETPAHEQVVTIRLLERWPAHEPRESDPHYKAFRAAKARMKKAGLLVCNVDSTYHHGVIELHHALVEFAHVNDVDLLKFNKLYGLDLTDDQFRDFVEGAPGPNGENALEPLCALHHRGQEGIHSLDGPSWNAMRVSKSGTNIEALSNSGIAVIGPK